MQLFTRIMNEHAMAVVGHVKHDYIGGIQLRDFQDDLLLRCRSNCAKLGHIRYDRFNVDFHQHLRLG